MDIVDDLRDLNSMHTPDEVSGIADEAANEIERLRQRDGFIAVLDKQIVEKDAEIERLREALRTICDGPRDVEKSYAELFVEVKIEARSALQQKDSE